MCTCTVYTFISWQGLVTLLQELAENEAYEALTYNLDWYILLSANPDSYEYTRAQSPG